MEDLLPQAIARWHEATPDLVAHIGDEGFAARLDRSLAGLVSFDLSCAFAYPGEARPLFLHDGLRQVSSPPIMANYLNGTYLLDAVYTACRRRTPEGLYRLKDLAPDAFFEGEYYNSPDVHPCISLETGSLDEEIVFLAPLAPTTYLAYSLLRQSGSGAFSDADLARLGQAAPMVAALMRRHWRAVATADEPADGPAPSRSEVIELAFQTFSPSTLTPREQAIVSLILRGHSSLSIGNLLEIAEGTVKIHRKHIYAKLGISSQTELFNLFIRHLLAER